MQLILAAATELVALLSPARIEALADRLRGSTATGTDKSLSQLVTTPLARAALDRLLRAWEKTTISGDVLAGILVGAAYARNAAQHDTSIDLVWTGPTTPYAPTRRTEQVLLDLIERAKLELFIVSFVAYDVRSVITAINSAIDRGVDTRILLESSVSQGGSLLVDPAATMRSCVPSAQLYAWNERPNPFTEGRVHAKVAVADKAIAFLTSANLTGHAIEKNMEAGIVITGGHIPVRLHEHLHALIHTNIIQPI
jgi:cardiolipin synthase